MQDHYRIIILGAGTAGMTAWKEARRFTEDFLLVDPGPLGTTCARVGCMPSKALLQVARDFHAQSRWAEQGLFKAPASVDIPAVLDHVRRLRDRFAGGAAGAVEKLGDRFVQGRARFVAPGRLEIDGPSGPKTVTADAVIVATGTQPVVPGPWQALGERVITSDSLFEQRDLPRRIAVVGLGAIGTEIGQALAMLGLAVEGFAPRPVLAGLDDEAVNKAALEAVGQTLPMHFGHRVELFDADGAVGLRFGPQEKTFDAVIASVGRRPNVGDLNLEALGLPLEDSGLPAIDPHRLEAGDTRTWFVGDVNGQRALMHEAADEGRIAAHQALNPGVDCRDRRLPLSIVFSEPEIAQVGARFGELPDGALIGEADFSQQGRAVLMGRAAGLLRVYADARGVLIGAQMAIPGAEHIAHELAWLIQSGHHVTQALQLPFYHPVLEEGLRSALQGIRRQLDDDRAGLDLPLCGDRDEDPSGLVMN